MATIEYKAKVTRSIKVKLIASIALEKIGIKWLADAFHKSAKRSLKFEPVK